MPIASALLALAVAVGSAGAGPYPSHPARAGRILPRGPGHGWGFPNGNPDGVGWYNIGRFLPLGADRTPDYYFRRHHALPPEQLFFPSYYNAYVTRGQRYIPYVGCGGEHPAGGPPPAPAELPVHPYLEDAVASPAFPLPTFSGRQEGTPDPGRLHETGSGGRALSRTPTNPPRSDRAAPPDPAVRRQGLMTRLWDRVTSDRPRRLGRPR